MQEVEIVPCSGGDIFLMDGILTEGQCIELINSYENVTEPQCIVSSGELKEKLWGFIKDKITNIEFYDSVRQQKFKIVSITNDISVTQSYFPVGRHVDRQDKNVFFKLAFYLNKVEPKGGTVFFGEDNEPTYVENKIGRGILFDISLPHESQKHVVGNIKYMIGARPVIIYID